MAGFSETLRISDIATKDSWLQHDHMQQISNPTGSDTIGKHVSIEKFIQAGAGGSVFKARNSLNKKLYAVKIFPPHMARWELSILQCERMKVDHPGREFVVRIFATSTIYSSTGGPLKNRMIAFLPYCDGGDLCDLIDGIGRNKQDVPEAFVWKIIYELLSACEFLTDRYVHANTPPRLIGSMFDPAHSQYIGISKVAPVILHRDLKPDNVLLRWPASDPEHKYYPQVMLVDFGMALELPLGVDKAQDNLTLPAWGAPERSSCACSETWGVGAIAHGICHRGVPPIRFKVNNPWNITAKLWQPINQQHKADFYDEKRRKQVRPLPGHLWSKDLDQVVRKLLTEPVKYRMEPKEAKMWVKEKIIESGWGTEEKFVELPSWAAKRGVFETIVEMPKLEMEVDEPM